MKATDTDVYQKYIKVKFKSLIAASDYIGPIVIHFYSLTDTDIVGDFIAYKVPGLCIGGNIILNWQDIGYVVLSKGKDDDNNEIYNAIISERVMKWYYKNIVLPFISNLRKTGENENNYVV